jgi:hypothetical protein
MGWHRLLRECPEEAVQVMQRITLRECPEEAVLVVR